MSLELIGNTAFCWVAIWAPSSVFGAGVLLDCRPIGVGAIKEGAAGAGACGAGLTLFSEGVFAGATGSAEFSIAGSSGALPVSSSVIAILNVPSTITTTLAPTSSERIFEEMFEGVLSSALSPALALSAPLSFGAALARPAFSGGGAAAAACAARRAAAMKLDELTGSFGPA